MKKEKKDESFLKKPWYKGGQKAMSAFIHQRLVYPDEAVKNRIEGTVIVKADIDYTGKVVDAKVARGLGYGCDEEAVRLVKLLKFEVAKTPRKMKVLFHRNINLNFNLPKQKSENQHTISSTIQYTIAPSPKATDAKNEPVNKPKTFTYTIKI